MFTMANRELPPLNPAASPNAFRAASPLPPSHTGTSPLTMMPPPPSSAASTVRPPLPPPPVAAAGASVGRARALYKFVGTQATDLSFEAGDEIELLDTSLSWWKGRLNGHVGSFPSNYAEKL